MPGPLGATEEASMIIPFPFNSGRLLTVAVHVLQDCDTAQHAFINHPSKGKHTLPTHGPLEPRLRRLHGGARPHLQDTQFECVTPPSRAI